MISSHGHRGLPTKMSPKFLFPDSIPFHLTSRKLLFDSSLCRRSPLFPMHMTVSKKTHCARRLQPLTRIFPRALYRAAAITRQAFRCLSSSLRRRKRRGWFAFSERPIKNRIKKKEEEGDGERKERKEKIEEKEKGNSFLWDGQASSESMANGTRGTRIDFCSNDAPFTLFTFSLFIQSGVYFTGIYSRSRHVGTLFQPQWAVAVKRIV